MIVLSGADLVLPDRVTGPSTLVIDGERIVEIAAAVRSAPDAERLDLQDHYVLPGFIDVHVHGVGGRDSLDGADAVGAIAAILPRFGVTAFCPTTIACEPAALRQLLSAVRDARATPVANAARVLPAHLESNFINPEYKGAQPAECLRMPPAASAGVRHGESAGYTGAEVLAEIEQAGPDVGIVTLAPELDGATDLIRRLSAAGIRVSLGHSGATLDQALEAVAAGATQATHLFNRMPRLDHRDPGLAGAVLCCGDIAAEVICDGYHVHAAMVHLAVAAKGPSGVMAITDGTAGSSMPAGTRTRLGGRTITVTESGARLDDGTLAGSTLTMDGAFRVLVERVGLSLVDAAQLCATTPARQLNLHGLGVLAAGAQADLVVLDRVLSVVQTYIRGRCVYSATPRNESGTPAGQFRL
jgi:N-acetylglucosamine-6-phosphate deacetylase